MANETKKKDITEQVAEIEGSINKERAIQKFSRVRHRLSKPFKFEGETYEELDLDFEGLTGQDMEAIDDELTALRISVPEPAASRKYQKMLAARAAKVPSNMIEHLPLRDYNRIITAARYFLLITG